MAKLAALVPKPRVNLTWFFGVFAPNSQYRMTITKEKRQNPEHQCYSANRALLPQRSV